MKPPDKSKERVESREDRLGAYREDIRRRYQELKAEEQGYLQAYSTATESTLAEKWLRFVCATWPRLAVIGAGVLWQAVQGAFGLVSALAVDSASVLARVRLRKSVTRKLVSHPPGLRLLKLAEILFSPKTVVLTFKPLIADWQFEYFDGLTKKYPVWRLRLISFRYYWYFTKACGLSKVAELFRSIARSRP